MPGELPVVYLAFANAPDAHLGLLKTESREVLRALNPLQEAGRITVHREESTELTELYADLLAQGDRLVIFHYAGHADGRVLQLEGGEGTAAGLARLLGQQTGLKLVFLNGCASQGHVPLLLDAGVPAVIATSVPIGDQKAQEFATAFYAALAEGRSISQAFESGRGFIEGRYGVGGGSGPGFSRDIRRVVTEVHAPVLEWGLFTRDDSAEEVEQWRLTDARAAWRVQLADARGPIRDLDGNPLPIEHRLPARTVPALRCPSCGATSSAPGDESACPVCGSADVERGPARTMLAERILPFAVSAEDARRRVLEHGDAEIARDAGTAASSPEVRLQPLFVPCWIFDVARHTSFEAERAWNRALGQVTPDFQWEPVRDEVDLAFDSFLVPAGGAPAGRSAAKDGWFWELEAAGPFDRLAPAAASVLLDRSIESAFGVVVSHLDDALGAEIEDRLGGHRQRNLAIDTRYRRISARTVLLPHWYATIRHERGRAHFVVNGQNGAVRRLHLDETGALVRAGSGPGGWNGGGDEPAHTLADPGEAPMSGRTYEPGGQPAGAGDAVSVFSGAGIGLMVGILLGLAVSPVVGIFVGALGTGLAGVLGLNDRHFSRAKGLRIGAFGLAAVAGAAAGISIRTHDLFSPSLAARKAEYLALGFTEREALDLLAGSLTAVVVAGGDSAAGGRVQFAAAGISTAASVLFSSPVEISACSSLTTAYDDELSAADVIANFRLEGAGWRSLADSTEARLAEADRKPLLFIARDAACGSTPPRPTREQCRRLERSGTDASTALEAGVADVTSFRPVLDRVTREITPAGRPDALRLLGGVFCATPP